MLVTYSPPLILEVHCAAAVLWNNSHTLWCGERKRRSEKEKEKKKERSKENRKMNYLFF
jgi:hypothetical protein